MADFNKNEDIVKQTAAAEGGSGEGMSMTAEIPASLIAESENSIPMVAMKGLVIFPNVATSFNVGRAKSLSALNIANGSGKHIFLALQRDKNLDNPTPDDIYTVGVVCKIKRLFHFENNVSVHVEGLYRARIKEYVTTEDYFSV